MTSIHQIFDADATELHDLRADPNTIIKIQGLVKEMIEANDNRQLGISREIVEEYGTFALPGIISATYVLGDQLNNKKRRDTVGQLMAELSNNICLRIPNSVLTRLQLEPVSVLLKRPLGE